MNYIDLLNKLILDSSKISQISDIKTQEHLYIINFFSVIDSDEIKNIYEKFVPVVRKCFKVEICIELERGGNALGFIEDDVVRIYSFFLLNSFLTSSTIEKGYDFNYISSNKIIEKFNSYLRRFWVYYYNSIYPKEVIGPVMDFYTYLTYKKVIFEKNTREDSGKTYKYLSIGHVSPSHRVIEKLHISTTPYLRRVVGGKNFLVGSSFLNTTEMCKENIHSGFAAEFPSRDILDKLTRTAVYISKQDFIRIMSIYENHYSIKIPSIPEKMNELSYNNETINKELFEINKVLSSEYNARYDEIIDNVYKNYDNNLNQESLIIFLYVWIINQRLGDVLKNEKDDIILQFITLYRKMLTRRKKKKKIKKKKI